MDARSRSSVEINNHSAESPAPAPAPPRRPVFARHAASLLVVRQGPEGPSVLMGVRAAGHRFMPNKLVFPGGAVDAADATAPAATEPRPDVLAQLAQAARPRLARALVFAAARELSEETGLSLGAVPRLDGIDYLCRAVTPPASPIRFNARFLVVDAEACDGVAADSGELQDLRFRPVRQAVQDGLMQVTHEVLGVLLAWLDLPPERRAARRLAVFRQRAWVAERATPRGPASPR